MINQKLKIIECPRDAMQSWKNIIPTKQKIEYLSLLGTVGFDTIDCGSFVSSKLIPQMADTAEVLAAADLGDSNSKLLVIVANVRGAEEAIGHQNINYLGFPFSVSSTFQHLNANSSIKESFESVKTIQSLCNTHGKEQVVYISMAFGNPYKDEYNEKIVLTTIEKIAAIGIHVISLADTVGLATPSQIASLVKQTIHNFPEHEIGVHLHSKTENREDKIDAAFDNGCLRFDGAIKGFGGCPMSGSELIGNMDTGWMIRYFEKKGYLNTIDDNALKQAEIMASKIFV